MTEEQSKLSSLPKGWAWTTIGDICDLINGRAFKRTDWSPKGLPIIRIKNLNNAKASFNYCNFRVDDKYVVDNGQLLFAWSGTPGTSFGAHIWNKGKAVLNQHIFKVNIDEKHINKIFFMYLINYNVAEYIRKAHGSAGLAHITKGKFETSYIPLPPFPEQGRTVSKLEELFTKLDAGVKSLQNVKAQLQRYRQAFSKHAFEGKLTERWRNAHKDQIEPVQVFLERMGEEQKKNTGGKPRESSLIDSPGLYELPLSWMWIRLGEVTESMKNGIYKPKRFYSDDGIACLRMYNIESGKIVWKDIKRMILTSEEVHAYELKAGDILVNRVNSRELVGKAAVIPKDLEICVYESKNIRLRLLRNLVENKYVNFWLQIFRQKYFNRHAQQTVGMASVNQEQLSSMPVPLSPLLEQRKIVEEIEHSFSIVDEIEKNVNHSMAQAEKLRQAVLRKAFWGKLALQDPTDESAEKLLERIREEKEKRKSEEKGIKGKRKGRRRQMGLISYVK